MSFYDKSLANDEKARDTIAADYCKLVSRAKAAATGQTVRLDQRLREGNDYYYLRQPLRGVEYQGSTFRDATVRNNVMIFASLLTANRPRYSFMPVEPYDVPLTAVFRKLDDWYSSQMQFDLKYKLCMKDMLKFGTGFLMLFINEQTKDLDLMVPTLAEIMVDDWTQWDMSKQRRFYRLVVEPVERVLAKYPHLAGKLDPSDDSNYTELLQQMTPSWGQLSGTENPLESSFNRTEMKKEWLCGNCVGWEIWETVPGKQGKKRSYIYNGKLGASDMTDWPDFPLVPFRNHLDNGQFLGMGETEIVKSVCDTITEAVHSMQYHKALFSRGIWLRSELLPYDDATFQEIARHPGSTLSVPDRIFERGGLRMLQPQPLNAADTQMIPLMREMGNYNSGNSQWLQGSVAPGEDPASKVQYLQQAGLNRVKMQAKLNDEDGLRRLGDLRLWYYQNHVKAHKVIRIVGENKPDGTPRFMDLNMELTRETLDTLIDVAQRSGEPEKVPGYNTRMTADELIEQKRSIEARAATGGVILTYKLNATDTGKYDISIEDSDALPFNDAQKRQTLGMLAELGMASAEEVRGIFGFPVDPESMGKLKATVPMIPVEQIAQQLEQSMGDEQAHMAAMQQVIQYIAELQKRVGA